MYDQISEFENSRQQANVHCHKLFCSANAVLLVDPFASMDAENERLPFACESFRYVTTRYL